MSTVETELSTAEIVKRIATLPLSDIGLIEEALRQRRAEETEEPGETPATPGRKMSGSEAMDYVFDNFDGLLHKLAQ